MAEEYDKLSAQLETLGESEVRVRFAHGAWSERSKRYVEVWLNSKDREREEAASAKRDAREEETLSIAKDANRLASEANDIASRALAIAEADLAAAKSSAASAREQARWAKWAAILAAIAAIIATKDQMLELMFPR